MKDATHRRLTWIAGAIGFVTCFVAVLGHQERLAIDTVMLLGGVGIGQAIGYGIRRWRGM